MNYLMLLNIAEIYILLQSNISLDGLVLYKDFIITQNKQIVETLPVDINITINMNIDFDKTLLFTGDETYLWKNSNKYIELLFCQRQHKLSDSLKNDIWLLKCSKDFKKCMLCIPPFAKTDPVTIRNELEDRPWLQRLIIAYLMHTDQAVFHGAVASTAGRGLLLLGDSGRGKSTACKIIRENNAGSVLTDDRFLLTYQNGKIYAYGTPWNTKNKEYNINGVFNINEVYFLFHGNNTLLRLPKNLAVILPRMLTAIMHSNIYDNIEILRWKSKIVKNMIGVCEFNDLYFSPDISMIQLIKGNII